MVLMISVPLIFQFTVCFCFFSHGVKYTIQCDSTAYNRLHMMYLICNHKQEYLSGLWIYECLKHEPLFRQARFPSSPGSGLSSWSSLHFRLQVYWTLWKWNIKIKHEIIFYYYLKSSFQTCLHFIIGQHQVFIRHKMWVD